MAEISGSAGSSKSCRGQIWKSFRRQRKSAGARWMQGKELGAREEARLGHTQIPPNWVRQELVHTETRQNRALKFGPTVTKKTRLKQSRTYIQFGNCRSPTRSGLTQSS